MKRKCYCFVFLVLSAVLHACSNNHLQENDDAEILNPSILSIIPNTGSCGDRIMITGKNLGNEIDSIKVLMNETIVEPTTFSQNKVSFILPNLTGKVDVAIQVDNKKSNKVLFTYKDVEVENDYAQADKEKIKKIMEGSAPSVWVFTGNSITQGAKHTHGFRSYCEIFSERIRWEMGRFDDTVINTAISGHTTSNILGDFEWRIGQFHPNVVVLMLGTNDAATTNNISVSQFSNNVLQLITEVRKIGAVPLLMSPNPIIVGKAMERFRLSEYVSESKVVAKNAGAIFVDNWTLWNTDLQLKYQGEIFKLLLNDPLHPNGLGHQELAYALFKALSIFDPLQSSCGGAYYEGEH